MTAPRDLETPRTDALEFVAYVVDSDGKLSECPVIHAKQARQLERELRQARDAIIAMAEDGWLSCGNEGMSDAQQKCLAAYKLIKPLPSPPEK